MEIVTNDRMLVVYRDDKPIASFDPETNTYDVEGSLDSEDVLELVGIMLRLIHENSLKMEASIQAKA